MVPAEIASFGRPQSVPVRQAKQDAAERAAYLRDIRPPPRTFLGRPHYCLRTLRTWP
jgi:hypothetical protein